MARIDDALEEALKLLPPKPGDTATQSAKKGYSERISAVVAVALAAELRARGLADARPSGQGELGDSGAERRMAGGIGGKKVDVTWATPEAGLLLAISVKTINFRDRTSNNFQKNLINRRGELLMEAVTLHRRFPYAVLGGLFFIDKDAEHDQTQQRRSTFLNAHHRLKLFTDRSDPAGRDEQLESLHLVLLDASPTAVAIRAYRVGDAATVVPLASVLDELLKIVADRSPDFYEFDDGCLRRPR